MDCFLSLTVDILVSLGEYLSVDLGRELLSCAVYTSLSFFEGQNLMLHLSQELREGTVDLRHTLHIFSPDCININIIFGGGWVVEDGLQPNGLWFVRGFQSFITDTVTGMAQCRAHTCKPSTMEAAGGLSFQGQPGLRNESLSK